MSYRDVARIERCTICKGEAEYFSTSKVLTYEAIYFRCKECSSVQVKNAFWLEEAHSRAISILDTGLVARCVSSSRLIGTFLFFEGKKKCGGIDWAGGTGLLARLLRDQGFEATTYDDFANGDLAQGFIAKATELNNSKVFISAIECLEHLPDPVKTFEPLTRKKDYFIFTTELIDTPPQDPKDLNWWYFMPESGQHITFATEIGLRKMAAVIGFSHYLRFGSLHVMSKAKIKLITRIILSIRPLRAFSIILIPEILNRKFSLSWRDKEDLINLL